MDPTCDDTQTNAPWPARADEPAILEEIEVEDLAVDGICGVY
jgi:mycofactocin precursor